MAPKKARRRDYYGIHIANKIFIRKGFAAPKRIVSTLTIPKQSGSPRYNEDGAPNNGTKLQQISYTGGIPVGVISYYDLVYKVGLHIGPYQCLKIDGSSKQNLIRLLTALEGENE